eukprot:COSAG05_NODE_2105_length_3552_cov_3.767738_7_plen_118_part_00
MHVRACLTPTCRVLVLCGRADGARKIASARKPLLRTAALPQPLLRGALPRAKATAVNVTADENDLGLRETHSPAKEPVDKKFLASIKFTKDVRCCSTAFLAVPWPHGPQQPLSPPAC